MMRFDECAHRYAEHAMVQRQMADWLAEWLDPAICANGNAVEFGAGEGMFTRRALPCFSHLRAVDMAPRMVELGREHVPQATWMQGDAWNGTGLDSSVSMVLSSSLMQWNPDPVNVLRLWHDQLPKGARMLHGIYVDPTLPELRNLQGDGSMPLTWLTPNQWTAAFKDAGWTLERFESETRCIIYPSALGLLRSLHGVGAVSRDAMSGVNLRKLIREYDRLHAVESGGVYANWTFCRIQAMA
ncbi:methyltransferase domain-containing protein [Cerasicoccus arenae]|uniref:Methyltransferase domain-containing protein n=1 Tax=Cerasicoccus arenae TaxID=424488 RepID=A0A8J3D9W4_9BACT|nr:methyltransferase domain-containing protein [Cerasicoccus arenae]MBK1859508.1 methyltransferase domain-containing protein [Cerasicoccus arenae]GHB95049.1 hypothetical protein GCM10007047_08300 [Cerasicoccus arenae]